uniref:AIG1-type G domain-containing protein n=1 Tax=Tanacetum cinerariifolium TaxID=118510 RepID=A0A699K5J5_TANCI|nr:hypothetical protein [Tanacetum cinerariifolium]
MFDSSLDLETIGEQIVRCIIMAKDGLHAVLFVFLICSRFLEEENVVVISLVALFKTKIYDFIIMVFIGGDELEDNGKTFEDFLHDSPEALKVEVRYATSLRDFSNSRNRKQNGLSETYVIAISVVSTVAAITLMFFTALLYFRNRRLGFVRAEDGTSTYYSSSLSSRQQKRPLFLNGFQHEMTSDGKTSWKLQTI